MTTPNPPKVDLQREQRLVRRRSVLAFSVCAPVLLLASLGLPKVLAFPADLSERLAFAIRADLVLGLWVMWAVRRVAKVRFESAEDNAGSAFRYEPKLCFNGSAVWRCGWQRSISG